VIKRAAFTGAEAAFVASRRVAHLGTVYPDGTPHVVPISTVLDMDRLVFATDRDSRKARNIKDDPHVCISFDEYTEDWSALQQVIVFGQAYFVQSGPEFARDRQLLYDTYTQYPSESPIEEISSMLIEVRAERVFGSGF
jgi:nitroimidazol reductase NimA-like FMN-containing flavoprotein (pyridoxamine 5'-phosphate oxidase superfamily)